MKDPRQSAVSRRRVAVAWQDCVWFPPVLARRTGRVTSGRRAVSWPVQIITDPTVCLARTLDCSRL